VLNESGVGKIHKFHYLSRRMSETVQDRTKVSINDEWEVAYALSIGAKINDLG